MPEKFQPLLQRFSELMSKLSETGMPAPARTLIALGIMSQSYSISGDFTLAECEQFASNMVRALMAIERQSMEACGCPKCVANAAKLEEVLVDTEDDTTAPSTPAVSEGTEQLTKAMNSMQALLFARALPRGQC